MLFNRSKQFRHSALIDTLHVIEEPRLAFSVALLLDSVDTALVARELALALWLARLRESGKRANGLRVLNGHH